MKIELAEYVRELLNRRDRLKEELDDFKNCDSITGNINEGCNGLGFRWEKDSYEITCLIEGYEKKIEIIEKQILNLQITGGVE